MADKIRSLVYKFIFPTIFWLAVWQAAAIAVDRSYFLPTVPETFEALLSILSSDSFIKITSLTLARILTGLALGIGLAAALAVLSYKFDIIYTLLSPLVSVIKATPVASIIILLWISMNGDLLSVLIALMMVFPIVWQNLYDGLASINKELDEVTEVFEFSFVKRLKLLVIPTLSDYFIPAVITATGLAFKSEIAAEIIAGVRNSIGQMIYHSKDALDTASVFAWTLIGVFFSIVFERLVRFLLKRRRSARLEVNK